MKKAFIKLFILIFAFSFASQAFAGQFYQNSEISPEVQRAIDNPLERWVSKEDLREIVNEVMSKKVAQQVIVVDTRDVGACQKMYQHLISLGWPANETMCTQDPRSPYVSVTLGTEVTEESLTPFQKQFQDNPNFFKKDGLSERRKQLYNRTRNIALLSGGVVAAFASKDEDESGWDMQGLKDNGAVHQIREHWKNGPVQDKDGPFINFVLHPISGSIYYQAARISGYGKLQSFGYSFFMSLLFWEYGVESIFETPSWNDIWATPVLGSLLGELFLNFYQDIEANGGMVLGSKKIGFGAKLFLNSAETLRPYINKIFQGEFIKAGQSGFNVQKCFNDNRPIGYTPHNDDYCPFFTIEFKF